MSGAERTRRRRPGLSSISPRWRSAGFDLAVFLFFLGSLVVLRWQSITSPSSLNPDEAQMGANALRIMRHGIGWLSSDGTTSGPLNSLPLLLPTAFGLQPTLQSGRLVASVLLALSAFLIYAVIRTWLGRWSSVAMLLPAVVALGFAQFADFLHYSSELLSMVLALLALLLSTKLFRSAADPIRTRLLAGGIGLLAGALPFAKIQTTPVGIGLAGGVAVFLVLTLRKQSTAPMAALCVGGVLPALLLLVPLVLAGQVRSFTVGYLGLANAYVASPLSVSQLLFLIRIDRGMATLFLWAAAVAVVAGAAVALRSRKRVSGPHRWDLVVLATFLVTAFASVITPGRPFPHYIQLAWPSLLLLAGFALGHLPERDGATRWHRAALVTAVALPFVLVVGPGTLLSSTHQRLGYLHANATAIDLRRGDLLRLFDRAPDSETLVWGWEPEWYLDSGDYPAGRESMNEFEIESTPIRGFMRDRLMSDLRKSDPPVLVDAVASSSFIFTKNQKYGLHSWSALRRFVDSGYQKVSAGPSGCPATYLRDDVAKAFEGRYITPTSYRVRAPGAGNLNPDALFDLQLFQAGCGDYLMDPNPGAGSGMQIKASFEPTRVSQIWILGAKPATASRWGARVSLRLVRGDHRGATRSVTLRPWPHWTPVSVGHVEADQLRMRVHAVMGDSPAIDEIAMFR